MARDRSAYEAVKAGVPIILMSEIAFHKLVSLEGNLRVSLPVGVGHSVLPFQLLHLLLHLLQKAVPWLYIYLCPAPLENNIFTSMFFFLRYSGYAVHLNFFYDSIYLHALDTLKFSYFMINALSFS